MPQLFRIGEYIVYFWSNEGMPTEPVHVHIAKGDSTPYATKIWITQDGRALICSNSSRIPMNELRLILRAIEANSGRIIKKWIEHFEGIHFYC